jgi:hypothetical protein
MKAEALDAIINRRYAHGIEETFLRSISSFSLSQLYNRMISIAEEKQDDE